MPAREFAAAAQTPGQALQPVVVRIGMWDNRHAGQHPSPYVCTQTWTRAWHVYYREGAGTG